MEKVILCILDGVGIRENAHGNAFLQARKPTFDLLWEKYPHSYLCASGESVGLPKGQMGNSEVGHMNIGAGRVIYRPCIKKSFKITFIRSFKRWWNSLQYRSFNGPFRSLQRQRSKRCFYSRLDRWS